MKQTAKVMMMKTIYEHFVNALLYGIYQLHSSQHSLPTCHVQQTFIIKKKRRSKEKHVKVGSWLHFELNQYTLYHR